MRQPSFAHLSGTTMWIHCDFDRTRLAPSPARVTLAPKTIAAAAATDPAPWVAVRGAACVIPCPPDLCANASVVLADPSVGLFAIADPPKMDSAWRPLSAP